MLVVPPSKFIHMASDPHPDFTRAMLGQYQRAIDDLNYRSPKFIERLTTYHGYDTATHYIQMSSPSSGFTTLWEKQRLDLSVEALSLRPEWHSLFDREDLVRARSRLAKYDYNFPPDSWNPDSAPPSPIPSDIDDVPPDRATMTVYRILRDSQLARNVKRLHNYECQICGNTIELPNGTRYAESHHIQPLGKHDGPDIAENIICVCPNHHAMLDYGVIPLAIDKLTLVKGHKLAKRFIDFHNNIHNQITG